MPNCLLFSACFLSIIKSFFTNFLKANDFEKVKELVEKNDADTTHQEEETGARFSEILEAFFTVYLKRSDAGCSSRKLRNDPVFTRKSRSLERR